MTLPQAYDPIYGYKYQILSRYGNEPYEHCDYAKDKSERDYLLNEYKMSYGSSFSFKVITLPEKYWEDK